MVQPIHIEPLDPNNREAIRKIAGWYFAEWETPLEKTVRRLSTQPNEDLLFQLTARTGEQLVATAGLCHRVNLLNVYPEFNCFHPWVALVYTDADSRKQGIGKELLKAIEQRGATLGLDRIYLYTFTAETLYRRCGWREITRVMYKEHDTVVMEKVL